MSDVDVKVTASGWRVFDTQPAILAYTYSFGPGVANALAVGGADGLFVVSPPLRADAGVFDDLARFGNVRALVASNAFHYMGIPEWKMRFPEARVFAPAQSIGRVARRTKFEDVAPLAEAATLAGRHLALVDMPYYKTGEVLVKIESNRGLVWYMTDIVSNMLELPSHPLIALVYRTTRSAPGLRFNKVAAAFMVKDKRALKRWLGQEVSTSPPQWLIPAHGDILELGADAGALRNLFLA